MYFLESNSYTCPRPVNSLPLNDEYCLIHILLWIWFKRPGEGPLDPAASATSSCRWPLLLQHRLSLIFQSNLHPSSTPLQEMPAYVPKEPFWFLLLGLAITIGLATSLSALCLGPTLWPLVRLWIINSSISIPPAICCWTMVRHLATCVPFNKC